MKKVKIPNWFRWTIASAIFAWGVLTICAILSDFDVPFIDWVFIKIFGIASAVAIYRFTDYADRNGLLPIDEEI